MKRKLIALAFGCVALVVCGVTLAQNTTSPIPPSSVPQVFQPAQGHAAQIPSANLPVTTVVSASKTAAKPEDMTIEQILDVVENIREQREELEKKEKLYLKVLHRKTEKLRERIDRVDGDPTTPPSIIAPSTSVIPAPLPSLYIPPTNVPVSP